MRRRRETSVIVKFSESMELTKRNSQNSLTIEVRRDGDLLGTLLMGRGSVEWWPKGNKVHSVKKRWREFAEILEEHMR